MKEENVQLFLTLGEVHAMYNVLADLFISLSWPDLHGVQALNNWAVCRLSYLALSSSWLEKAKEPFIFSLPIWFPSHSMSAVFQPKRADWSSFLKPNCAALTVVREGLCIVFPLHFFRQWLSALSSQHFQFLLHWKMRLLTQGSNVCWMCLYRNKVVYIFLIFLLALVSDAPSNSFISCKVPSPYTINIIKKSNTHRL